MYTGPNIIEDGLVFGYDADDRSSRFYKGEPTTNLIPDQNFNTVYGSSLPTSVSNGVATFTEASGDMYCYYVNNYGQSVAGRNFSFSCEMKAVDCEKQKGISIYWQDQNGSWIFENNNWTWRLQSGTADWSRIAITSVAPSNATSVCAFIGLGYTNVTDNNGRTYVRNVQLEEKTHATQYTIGKRILSNSLIDLKRPKKIEYVYVNGFNYPVEEDSNGKWVKIFHHYNANGTILFANDSEAALTNEGNQSANKFSIFSRLENFRRTDNKLKFKINYPEITNGYNIWYQTSNPNNESIAGYEPILINQPNNYFGGIAVSGSDTWLDCSPTNGTWYFAVGAKNSWSGAIPGPTSPINYVDVYLSIEDTYLSNNCIDLSNVSFDSNAHPIFDGTSDYIKGFYNSIHNTNIGNTVECIAYLQQNGYWASLVQKPQTNGAHTANYFDYAIYANTDGAIHTRIDGEGSTSPNYVYQFNKWNHFVITWSNQLVSFYVNGVLVGTSSNSKTNIVFDNNTDLIIGSNAAGTESVLGKIPVVRIYNKPLSLSEVQQNYNAYKSRFNI